MSTDLVYESKDFDELRDIFLAHLLNQEIISNYPFPFFPIRTKLIEWINWLCRKFSFKKETLYRTISLFDLYISLKPNLDLSNHHNNKLIIISCLSLATKLNELKANYIKFFTKNILNQNGKKICYSNLDIPQCEMDILKVVDYSTNSANILHFNSIFLALCLKQISPMMKQSFIKVNDRIMGKYLLSAQCITQTPIKGAIIVINTTLSQFSNEQIEKRVIMKSFEQLKIKNSSLIFKENKM